MGLCASEIWFLPASPSGCLRPWCTFIDEFLAWRKTSGGSTKNEQDHGGSTENDRDRSIYESQDSLAPFWTRIVARRGSLHAYNSDHSSRVAFLR